MLVGCDGLGARSGNRKGLERVLQGEWGSRGTRSIQRAKERGQGDTERECLKETGFQGSRVQGLGSAGVEGEKAAAPG